VANAHIDAINGQTAEGQPVEGFARLMGLFPAAGAEGGGLLAPAVEKGATTIGTYAGIKSATADLKALAKAKRMEKAGESAKPDGRIRQVTGWFKDPSGDWQYEISDLNARVDPHPTDPDRYMFTHPELDAAYPGSTNMPIHRLNRDSDSLGWYQNPGVTSSGPEAGIRAGLTDAEKRSVALHEIGGHHVQDREGFARGSTPSKNVARSQELTQPLYDEANRRVAAGEMTEDQAMDCLREATKGKTADDLYRANLGEYAARDIQARADYPDWKRQAVPPYSSEPTPPGGWIDNRGASKGERSAMAEPPPPDIPILPPPENARLTQIATTGPTYQKAMEYLRAAGVEGDLLDFGAGRGHGAKSIGAHSYEPYPPEGFSPNFTRSADIPEKSYNGVLNLNVLNVLPPDLRDAVVKEIGRVMAPKGQAIITTRGRDVMAAKGQPGPEPMSLIIGEGDKARYQKGFTQRELTDYLTSTLGEDYAVDPLKLGPAGARVTRLRAVAPSPFGLLTSPIHDDERKR
jgi:SAM-dependent methyltransferase